MHRAARAFRRERLRVGRQVRAPTSRSLARRLPARGTRRLRRTRPTPGRCPPDRGTHAGLRRRRLRGGAQASTGHRVGGPRNRLALRRPARAGRRRKTPVVGQRDRTDLRLPRVVDTDALRGTHGFALPRRTSERTLVLGRGDVDRRARGERPHRRGPCACPNLGLPWSCATAVGQHAGERCPDERGTAPRPLLRTGPRTARRRLGRARQPDDVRARVDAHRRQCHGVVPGWRCDGGLGIDHRRTRLATIGRGHRLPRRPALARRATDARMVGGGRRGGRRRHRRSLPPVGERGP
ncbi:unannotated protein [freshwater metagenome]|uniref:Unannotated protein n=1 Tax=freshwater metagenome TaxID=449393 RepID=A0A6J6FZR7_9ZZZZ